MSEEINEGNLEIRMIELRNSYLKRNPDNMICLENACYEIAKKELEIDMRLRLPTIKVSELKSGAEANLGSLEDEPTQDYSDGYNYALEELLTKFCEVKE